MIFISKRTTVKFTAKSKFYRKEADFPLVTFFTIDLHYCLHFGLYFQEKKKKYLSGFNCAELVPLAPYMQQLGRHAASYKNIEACQLEIQFRRIIQDNETQPA